MKSERNAQVPWYELIRQELLPYHGRMAGSLRTTLAVTLTVILMMVLRTPAVPPGAYLIYLISYETPYLTLTSGIHSLLFQCIGVASALLLVMTTDNAPIARVLGTALFSFLAAFLMKTMRRRGGLDFGVFSLMTLSLWDQHGPADTLVKLSMWPVATGALGIASAVAVEYLFARRDPFYALHLEFQARLRAIENFLRAYAQEENAPNLQLAAKEVVRLSFAGQGRMLSLLREISTRKEGAESYVEDLPLMLPHLFRLLDLTATLAIEEPHKPSMEEKLRIRKITATCATLRENPFTQTDPGLNSTPETSDHLGLIEQTLSSLVQIEPSQPVSWESKSRGVKQATPSWFVPDAWTNPAYTIFALKIALCATIGYILYMALNWPGIQTVVLTVVIVGLSNTGAISQKLIFRLTGSMLGGVVFGIGSVIFLFPYMDSITSLALLVAAVAFIASWLSRAPHISYIGLQIAFSFFIVAFESFSAPTDMVPGRDRILGIGLALLLVWIVFLEITPIRTVDEMRRSLSRVLSAEAELLRLTATQPELLRERRPKLRETIARQLVGIRSMAETVPYEIGTRRQLDRQIGEGLVEASLSAGSLFLTLETWMHHHSPSEALPLQSKMATELSQWAKRLENGERCGEPGSRKELFEVEKDTSATKLASAYSRLHDQLEALCD